jgi:hypothetical protein
MTRTLLGWLATLREDDPPREPSPKRSANGIKAKLKRDEAAIGEELERSGRYILATNIPSEAEELTNDELLAEYKGRQSVQRAFRFLKDPLFFTSSVFVKTPRRVAAIAMVMGLCLLVYVRSGSVGCQKLWPKRERPFAIREANRPNDRRSAVGVPAVPGAASVERGRREANLQPHRRAKIHPGCLEQ